LTTDGTDSTDEDDGRNASVLVDAVSASGALTSGMNSGISISTEKFLIN
jgi:hypothetical protein